ncbi:MAG TPA: T9SS type A sorting domain-containing protein [Ignavibacteria bacterium]|nr:T9SS type A sorting domain-containing protein [Ignavibacteria bacterium]
MKKLLTILFFVLLVASGSASAQPVDSTTLNAASITGTVTLSNSTVYIMKGFNYVRNGGKIVIEPGTLIKGDKATTGTLIIERGGKIHANGTANRPIIFTSRFNPGQRNPQDWGGVLILGRSGINTSSGADSAQIEGFPAGTAPWYGGQPRIDDDSSGVFRYVRIEFAGYPLTPGNEINGLTCGGVGSKTLIEYVQISYCGDDSFEFFGGTLSARYLVAFGTVDDDFDMDNGHRGHLQFGLAVRDSNQSDVSGSHFFEIDNNNNSPANFNAPRTKTIFSNFTCIGPKTANSTSVNPNFVRGAHLRRNMLASIYNSVMTGYNVGIRFDGSGVFNAATGDTIQVRNTIFSGFSNRLADTAGSTSFSPSVWLMTGSYANRVLTQPTDVNLTSPYSFYGIAPSDSNVYGNVNWYVPQAGSQALSGSDFTNPNLSGFTSTTYVGAFGSGSTSWLTGWTNFNPKGYNPRPNSVQQISSVVPGTFKLTQNYPNPFNPITTINFSVPVKGFVSLKIYDVTGRMVADLVNQEMIAGEYKYDFNASNLNSGVYFYTLRGNNFSETKKMMLIK